MSIAPAFPSVIAGHSVQFAASTPWGNEALWSVLPATAGNISASGLYTASATPGTCTVYAVWSQDVRYTASTGVTILPPPPPAHISPNLVQAFGALQSVPGTGISNRPVGGEPIPAKTAAASGQGVQVRHGFHPSDK